MIPEKELRRREAEKQIDLFLDILRAQYKIDQTVFKILEGKLREYRNNLPNTVDHLEKLIETGHTMNVVTPTGNKTGYVGTILQGLDEYTYLITKENRYKTNDLKGTA